MPASMARSIVRRLQSSSARAAAARRCIGQPRAEQENRPNTGFHDKRGDMPGGLPVQAGARAGQGRAVLCEAWAARRAVARIVRAWAECLVAHGRGQCDIDGLARAVRERGGFGGRTLWRHNQAGDLPHDRQRINRARLLELVRANRGRKGFTYTRHAVLGDGPALGNARLAQAANMAGFTVNLSANDVAHADQLADLGVGPVVCVLPTSFVGAGNVEIRTPKGRRVVVCPATYREAVSCATCGLCQVVGRGVVVGFPAHGAGAGRIS